VFAFGDWVCLKLSLYKDNEVTGLTASVSVLSFHDGNINETRKTFGTVTSESDNLRAMMST